ncbi:chemotaxis protein methyltransferase CheR [Ruminiclostridium sufflavum DSM 19573]|uniref:protein-glutamate O-methyltransferase n=1 Tax=Ruminiclostridium sufflavum DSM 19573 TaxID=1121337 RepID=A0A318XHK9_9FIRM|nr:protein-glutamate O-methyltransferase CheR [Ruminiclostridium sufflavum]PYG84351.1 chemotaxis protein methyltransferase CheR [Ruminiclostridium sufflavum DSM 19573]
MLTITDEEFLQLAAYIKENYGINLKEEKKALVSGRLYNVLLQNNINNYSEYVKYIFEDKTGTAVTTLVNKITTNHTFFMREAEHFYYLRDSILPYLTAKGKDKDIRIWSAGCSSGEEPYTLAMLIDEFLGKEKIFWDSRVLATDISDRVLELAKNGVYSNEGIEALPASWKANYFSKISMEKYEIIDKIKSEIIFRKFNLMDETFPFRRKFHVIFCRNVMIYFDEQTKHKLVEKFYNSLERGGYLFIGHSESLNRKETKFKYLRPAVYRKE